MTIFYFWESQYVLRWNKDREKILIETWKSYEITCIHWDHLRIVSFGPCTPVAYLSIWLDHWHCPLTCCDRLDMIRRESVALWRRWYVHYCHNPVGHQSSQLFNMRLIHHALRKNDTLTPSNYIYNFNSKIVIRQ